MKFKTIGLLSITAISICSRATAQQESILVETNKETNFVTRIPLIGDEKPVAALLASPRNYLEQPLVICGGVTVDNYYNDGFLDASRTHFSLDFRELRKDVEPTGGNLQIYADRSIAQPLIDKILTRQKVGHGLVVRLKIKITARCFDDGNFSRCAELIDWQFLTPDENGWEDWPIAKANAAAKELETKHLLDLQAQKAAAQAAVQSLAESNREELEANAVKSNQELADKGDAYGELRMGERYRDGDGVPKDESKAREFFAKSAAQGNTDAVRALARMNPAK